MKKTILLVDDEIDIQNRYFLQAGYDVLVAHDGKEGLELFRKKSIDVIITDIMMPYKSGLEITAFSKKNYPSIPIIIVSALGKEDLTVIEGFKLGVDDFIAKPFNPIELVLRVKRFV